MDAATSPARTTIDDELDDLMRVSDGVAGQADDVLATADAALRSELDELFNETADEVPPLPTPTPEPAAEDDDPGEAKLDAELDALFDEYGNAPDVEPDDDEQQPADEATAEPATGRPAEDALEPEVTTEEAAGGAVVPTELDADAEDEVDSLVAAISDAPDPESASEPADSPDAAALRAELAADAAPAVVEPERVPEPEPEPTPAAPQPEATPESPAASPAAPRPSLPIRLLVLLNAPFARLPDRARTTLGWVGVVTLVNALALLAYTFYALA